MEGAKKNILADLDLFGIHYSFSFDGNLKYRTRLGGLFTIATVILTLLTIYLLCLPIITKNNPTDLLTVEVDQMPKNLTLNMSIAFLFVDSTTSYIKNFQRYMRFEAKYHYLVNTNGIFNYASGFPKEIKTRMCKKSDFSQETAYQYDLMALNNAICFDDIHEEIGGNYSGNYIKYITMTILTCKNSSLINGDVCASEEEIGNSLSSGNTAIAMHYNSLQYNASNFRIPVTQFILEDDYKFDIMFCKHLTYYVQNFIINTDKGLFWEDSTEIKLQTFDKFKSELSRNLESSFSEKVLFDFHFLPSINTKIHQRSYLKGTSVIAQVGGLLKIYLIIGEYLFYFLYNKRMSESIISKLFYLSEKDLNSEKNLEHDIIINSRLSPWKRFRDNHDEKQTKFQPQISENLTSLQLNIKKVEHHPLKNMPHFENIYKLKKKSNIDTNNLKSNFSSQAQADVKSSSKEIKLGNRHKVNFNDHIINCESNLKCPPKRIDIIFSIKEYFFVLFCKCCYSKKLREKEKKFRILLNASSKYTDILSIINYFMDVKKLKFTFLNKKQLSLFNLITPYSPISNQINSTMAEKMKYEASEALQKEKAEEFFKLRKEDIMSNYINRRLFKLYGD